MKKHIIRAVHEMDLRMLLEKLELSHMMEEGKLRCGLCGRVIDFDNLSSIYPSGEEVKVCCNSLECYKKMFSEIAE